MAKLTAQTLVPIGAIIAAVLMTVAVMRTYFADTAQTAMLKVQVEALEQRVARNESRLEQNLDKSDERWDAIKEDLAKIKERLGIVEARPLPK